MWRCGSIFHSISRCVPAARHLRALRYCCMAIFTVFYPLIANVLINAVAPSPFASRRSIYLFERFQFLIMQLMPNELFSQATSTLLMPTVRSLGPLTMEQMDGALPGPLPLGQSLLLVWPQLTGLIGLTLICFILSYLAFMRREIRSR